MTTIREMFMHELTRLLADYERCDDEQIKSEIYIDINLLRKVIIEETTKKSGNLEEEFEPNFYMGQVNKITE